MAFSTADQDHPAVNAQINITPLVDVMLVLLIIFMVTMPMLSSPLDAALPQRADRTSNAELPSLQLQVNAAGDYLLDGQLLEAPALAARFADAAAEDPRTSLRMSAASSADYQRVVNVLSLARESGLRQIAIQQP